MSCGPSSKAASILLWTYAAVLVTVLVGLLLLFVDEGMAAHLASGWTP